MGDKGRSEHAKARKAQRAALRRRREVCAALMKALRRGSI
jgi:hypothetical protein